MPIVSNDLNIILEKLHKFHSQSIYTEDRSSFTKDKPVLKVLLFLSKYMGKIRLINFLFLCVVILSYRIFTVPNHERKVFQYGHSKNNLRIFKKMNDCLAKHRFYDIETNGKPLNIIERLKIISEFRKIWDISATLTNSYHPDPLVYIQCIIAVATWIVYSSFELPKSISVICVANDHAPSTVALIYLAKSKNIKTCYIQHAPISEYFPPLDFDLSILYDRNTEKIYNSTNEKNIKRNTVFFTPFLNKFQGIKLISQHYKIGICLSYLINFPELLIIIGKLSQQSNVKEIILRPHPSYKSNLANLKINKKVIIDPPGTPQNAFFERTNLILVSNSGIVIESLHFGLPTFYLKGIDDFKEDYYGFVKSKILPTLDFELLNYPEKVTGFFDKNWKKRFSLYDETVLTSPDQCCTNLTSSLFKLLKD